MADEQDTPQDKTISKKEYDELLKLRQEKKEWHAKDEEQYEEMRLVKDEVEELKGRLATRNEAVRDLETERKNLEYEKRQQEDELREKERMAKRIATLENEVKRKDEDVDEFRNALQQLELDNRDKIKKWHEEQDKADELEFDMKTLKADLDLAQKQVKIYEDHRVEMEMSQDRLDAIEDLLQQDSILGRRLSTGRSINDYKPSEIWNLLAAALSGRERSQSPELNQDGLRPPRQRGKVTRTASLQDQLDEAGEHLDEDGQSSPSVASVSSARKASQGSLLSPKPSARSPQSQSPGKAAPLKLALKTITIPTLQAIEPVSPKTRPLAHIPQQTVEEIRTTRLVTVEYSTSELLRQLPVWFWALLSICILTMGWLYFQERNTWLPANEMSRQAVIRLRSQSRVWLPRLTSKVMFSTERLLGVQRSCLG
ncbi:phosphoribosylaminoimidazolecarboxamide formyltransferase/IMP cyclohydrolase [Sphaceloma murrayae]|uniref:Phosphoribosylaminoimidazolecarboxamide formyltransferase/IMP cyclohydrolase n=1 Tax=Sphaceloma murrayae TaxID=2082308 RepID=A0A2K1QYZ0_9PEZI|nr:phosphoribosylaminoimidazolecarboxamide formyltransferase/IMP cyclohydrolase [Sphaceloma murrayae]